MINDYVLEVDTLIGLLGDRGFGDRDRLFRKLVEESGEYAEAIEYNNGSYRKVEKYFGKCSPREKLREEIVDVVLMGLALARVDGMKTQDVLIAISKKLNKMESKYHGQSQQEEGK